jgi:hypothetical protein
LLLAAVGVSFMQFANKNSVRNIYITGLALFLGISVPQYFREYTTSAGHGPARTNAGWVYFAFPFTSLIFTSFYSMYLHQRPAIYIWHAILNVTLQLMRSVMLACLLEFLYLCMNFDK